jgi:hypothetical protein
MDRLCDQVDLLLSENRDLSARLRNLEHSSRGSGPRSSRPKFAKITSVIIRQDHDSSSTQSAVSTTSQRSSTSSTKSQITFSPEPTSSTVDHNGLSRKSAFEEQLHRSRVYRRAQSYLTDLTLAEDGLSTLALSICSSLTLGEVSNISIFALPVFADELSNASAYTFLRPKEAARIRGPDQTYDTQRTLMSSVKLTSHSSSSSSDQSKPKAEKDAITPKRELAGWWKQLRRNEKKLQAPPGTYCHTFCDDRNKD